MWASSLTWNISAAKREGESDGLGMLGLNSFSVAGSGNSAAIACLFSLLLSASAIAADVDLRGAAALADIYRGSFTRWDLNHNGTLEDQEIDYVIQDPSIKGPYAAALAAIKVYRRSHSDLSAFTIDDLNLFESEAVLNKQGKALLALHTKLCKRLSGDPPVLFARQLPHIDGIKQGNTGDCYLLATIGGLAYHDPERLASMFSQNSDGSYAVSFPGQETIAVPAPTDGEIAAFTDAGPDGYWLHVIEKAYGVYKDKQGKHPEVVDSVIHGGSGGGAIMFVTGNACVRYPTSATDIEEIRRQLYEALSNHRVVNTGTPSHCLTVLGYDTANDTITIWNPWGSSSYYKPAMQKMVNGVFTMPLPDFMHNFVSILVEKDRRATAEDYKNLKRSKKLHP